MEESTSLGGINPRQKMYHHHHHHHLKASAAAAAAAAAAVVILLLAQIDCRCLAHGQANNSSSTSSINGTFVAPKSFHHNETHLGALQTKPTIAIAPNATRHLPAEFQRNSSPGLAPAVAKTTNATSEPVRIEIQPAKSGAGLSKSTNSSGSFGEQPSASLIRPSILKNLFKFSIASRQNPSAAAANDDDDDVITKTIMIPMTPEDEYQALGDQRAASKFDDGSSGSKLRASSFRGQNNKLLPDDGILQLKPEASVQLTSTEMSRLLDDGEGPELYRQRELQGAGVTVGEESPAQIYRASASTGESQLYHQHHQGQMSSGGGGGGGGGFGSSFDSSGLMGAPHGATMFADGGQANNFNRLSQAGDDSGLFNAAAAFNHRFGAQFDDAGGSPQMHDGGRLMQSPNEFNEIHSARGFGSAGVYPPPPPPSSPPQSMMLADGFSSGGGSGLTRAGSEFISGAGGELGFGHQQQQLLGGTPMLERHASELQQGNSLFGAEIAQQQQQQHYANQHSPEMLYHQQQQQQHNFGLVNQATDSHGMMGTFSPGDEFASRYGQSRMGGQYGHLGHQQGASASSSQPLVGGGGGKLMPLSPVVPEAEEVSQSSLQEEAYQRGVASSQQQHHHHHHQQSLQYRPSRPVEVHEGLDDDDGQQQSLDQAGGYSSSGSGGREGDEQPTAGSGNDADQSNGTNNGDDDDETTMASVQEMNSRSTDSSQQQQQQQEDGPSLVLNFPPPVGGPERLASYVEFSRKGSAGYLGPEMKNQPKQSTKRSLLIRKQQQSTINHRSGARATLDQQQGLKKRRLYDPSENPAHAGKYIID